MKRLTLMRHAKSSWRMPGLPDVERPLNKRGKRDAPEMGRRLAQRGCDPQRLVSSPARRALATAKAVAKALGRSRTEIEIDDRIYGAGPAELVDVIRGLDDGLDHVMLFGHNPTVTEVVYRLTGTRLDNVPTSGVVDVELDVDAWRDLRDGGGRLVEFDYPKRALP
jgi:phosphohistidine phosphatase